MELESTTAGVIGAAMTVHRALGPGLLESAYARCLKLELEARKLDVRREVPVRIVFRGVAIAECYRIDLLVNDAVVVEVKAMQGIDPIHRAQLLTYLRLTGKRVGLLLNFNVPVMRDGIMRVVN